MDFTCNYYSTKDNKVYWRVQAQVYGQANEARIYTKGFDDFESLTIDCFVRDLVDARLWDLR